MIGSKHGFEIMLPDLTLPAYVAAAINRTISTVYRRLYYTYSRTDSVACLIARIAYITVVR